MRSETQMLELIIKTANEDDRVRAAYLTGSRANPEALKDDLQDYDVIFLVTETKSFYEDKEWIKTFGEVLYMQCPEEMDRLIGIDCDIDACYGWLVMFTDGNRLDLHVQAIDSFERPESVHCRILVDKDGLLENITELSDVNYRVKKPPEGEYIFACNEFWWCINNAAKGICRYEIPYAQEMINDVIRPQLIKMLSWKIGIDNDFNVSVGKSAKYMYRWLTEDEWENFLSTYSGSIAGEMERSLMLMCDMFSENARYVGEKLGFAYNESDEKAARIYLNSFLGIE